MVANGRNFIKYRIFYAKYTSMTFRTDVGFRVEAVIFQFLRIF